MILPSCRSIMDVLALFPVVPPNRRVNRARNRQGAKEKSPSPSRLFLNGPQPFGVVAGLLPVCCLTLITGFLLFVELPAMYLLF